MQVYLLRHGLAGHFGDPGWPDDRLRPLTSNGIARLNRHMEALAAMGIKVDVVLTSTYVRAFQTAEIAQTWLGQGPLIETESLWPGAFPSEVDSVIAERAGDAESVMLVGHEPQMSSLVSWFLRGDDSIEVRFKKGALARIDFERVPSGGEGELHYFLPPRIMDGLVVGGKA